MSLSSDYLILKTESGDFLRKVIRRDFLKVINRIGLSVVIVERPERSPKKMTYELKKGYYNADKAQKYFTC